MVALTPTDAEDPAELRDALARALDGGPALGFGMLGDAPRSVPDGTAVVIATSGSSGVPKRVALSGEALRASVEATAARVGGCLLYTSPSPRDVEESRMPSSA